VRKLGSQSHFVKKYIGSYLHDSVTATVHQCCFSTAFRVLFSGPVEAKMHQSGKLIIDGSAT